MLLSGCSPEIPPNMGWSLAPRTNPVARLLAQPTDTDDIWWRLNIAVSALQARARQQPEFAKCEETPMPGCTYQVQMAERTGKLVKCQRISLQIADGSPGELRIMQMRHETLDCPADLR